MSTATVPNDEALRKVLYYTYSRFCWVLKSSLILLADFFAVYDTLHNHHRNYLRKSTLSCVLATLFLTCHIASLRRQQGIGDGNSTFKATTTSKNTTKISQIFETTKCFCYYFICFCHFYGLSLEGLNIHTMRKERLEILGMSTVEQYIKNQKIKNLPKRFETEDGGFVTLAYMLSEYAMFCGIYKELDDEIIKSLLNKNLPDNSYGGGKQDLTEVRTETES